MPRVKIDYVASFSSEDPEHPANNLLHKEISKKRWLCAKGETSCSVVLQLESSVQISAVHIGVYHSALVEVLVGRSETKNDEFKVLVPSCTFINPMESRKSEGLERVRSFNLEQMSADVRDKKWDRVRVVCTQPYNKHCQFGLSFIHIFEPETKDNIETKPPKPTASFTQLINLEMNSDEEDFKPGELFAKHLQNKLLNEDKKTNSSFSTDSQIRRASSQAIKNISDSSTKLIKTNLGKDKSASKKNNTDKNNSTLDRQRSNLMYEDEDEGPHEKIDKIVQKHHDEKNKDSIKPKDQKTQSQKQDNSINNSRSIAKDSNPTRTVKPDSGSEKDKKKRPLETSTAENEAKRLRVGPVASSPHTLLADVVFALSGYANPRRAQVRDKALAMGARCERDWTPRCTHLICAFENTPKLKSVRSMANGDGVAVATAEWVDECCRRRRRLPWQWFATERARRVPQPPDADTDDEKEPEKATPETDCDTDDEIEKVLNKNQDRKTNSASESKQSNFSSFIIDENSAAQEMQIDSKSDEESASSTVVEKSPEKEEINENSPLPNFFEGLTFVIDSSVDEVGFDKDLLRRHIYAFGGEILQSSQLDEESEVNYVLCGSGERAADARAPGAHLVRADWLWRCHEKQRLCSVDKYLI